MRRLPTHTAAPAASAAAASRFVAQRRSFAAAPWPNEAAPPDAILGLTVAFLADKDANKVNLGVGAYRDSAGHPFVLESVKKAEKTIVESTGSNVLNHEYAPISGVPTFVDLAKRLTFTGSAKSEGALSVDAASVQSISGTGALRLAADFLERKCGVKEIFMPTPTWGNHGSIMTHANLTPKAYRYYDNGKNALDMEGLLEDLRAAPQGSAVLLHACAHNPTGYDPTQEQWKAISDVCKERDHICFFDSAYQGFASGDPVTDSWSIRHFVEQGHRVLVTQSFAKNMGMYGQRAGALHVVCENSAQAASVESHLKVLIRANYSSPPLHGARVVAEVLTSHHDEWLRELKGMADRINTCRGLLRQGIEDAGSTKSWSHVTDQIGMFAFTGLTKDQVQTMIKEHHIYLTNDGRISMAGVNKDNVDYIAKAIHAVSQ